MRHAWTTGDDFTFGPTFVPDVMQSGLIIVGAPSTLVTKLEAVKGLVLQ